MKKRLTLVLTTVLFAGPLLLATTPAAANDWLWGAGFSVGGFHFRIGHHADRNSHYYRTSQRIPSRYRCTDRCYVDSAHYYHHASCPVVRFHFSDFGYSSHRLYDNYAPHYSEPRYERRYYEDHRGYGFWFDFDLRYYDRRYYDRHDRYRDHRGRRDQRHHDRYDRRGPRRYRHHDPRNED